MTDTIKALKLEKLPTETIKKLLQNATGVQLENPSPEKPLAGLVHVTGIGQVSIRSLRAELGRR